MNLCARAVFVVVVFAMVDWVATERCFAAIVADPRRNPIHITNVGREVPLDSYCFPMVAPPAVSWW